MALAPKKTMFTPACSAATAARRSPSDQHSSWPRDSSTLCLYPFAIAVRTVERVDSCTRAEGVDVARARPETGVEVIAPVGVPGLPGVDVVFYEVGSLGGRVPDCEGDVALLVAVAHELQQVVALHEGGADGDLERG